MHRLVFLIVALVAAVVFVFYAKAGVEEWNRADAETDVLEEAYTGETKGKKVAQETYVKFWFHYTRYYRATFVYEVDGKSYQAETDTGMEMWDEEEVHYDPANPAKCYVGQYARQEDDSGNSFGIAIVALVLAIVFAAGGCGYF
ncbi:MAG: hypothetical protein MR630_07580 [Selenomonas sp.]|uniref:hypothetical protein n=1 Tax=Selenomonas sp. TaxID=2053611 RepID=UPI0025EF2A01|nr:hypothetical protein [Selenomonas sp.]MCI6232452.1 hypothetical protein [Selenomonas sp.]